MGYLEIAGAPDAYYELRSQHDLGISPREWSAMDLSERGKHIAYLRLSNMAELLERHEMLQREEIEAERNAKSKD